MDASEVTIEVPGQGGVCALIDAPAQPRAALVLAHGAGAGMRHAFLEALATGCAARGIATLRYQFPYMEARSRRPDEPAVAHATVRAACATALRRWPAVPLFAGGKSFGARMSSQAQAESPIEGVRGLVFVGFPLHPAGKPSIGRAAHLDRVQLPMLFLQGSRDELASLDLLRPVVTRLGSRARLVVIEDADHAFHVPARTGRKDAQVLREVADAFAEWALVPRSTEGQD